MILFLGGYAGSKFLGIETALPGAVVLGLLVALLIPAKTACSIHAPEVDATGSNPPIVQQSSPPMEIDERTEGDVTFLALDGQFETFSLPMVSEKVEALLADGGRRICMNCKNLSFITSTALGYLVEAGKRLNDLDGELVFSEPSRFFADTIRMLQLDLLFEIFESDAEAASHFAPNQSPEPERRFPGPGP